MTVWYDQLTAFDPVAGRVADGGEVELFDYTDTSFTDALTVTDGAGLSKDKITVSNGALAGFNGPDNGQVWAKSGDWITLWRSFSGMETAAAASATAAAASATSAGEAEAAAEAAQAAAESAAQGPTEEQVNTAINEGDHTLTGAWDFTNADVTGIEGGGGGGGTDVTLTDEDTYLDLKIADANAVPIAKADHDHVLADVSDAAEFARTVLQEGTDAAEFRTLIGAVGSGEAGAGTVTSVNGVDADEEGNVDLGLDAGDVSGIVPETRTVAGKALSSDVSAADLTAAISAASTTAKGTVELATSTETAAGTDTARATTPAGVAQAIASAPVNANQQAAIDAAASIGRILYGTNWPSSRPASYGHPLTWDDTAKALSDGSDTAGPDSGLLVEGDYWDTYRFEAAE